MATTALLSAFSIAPYIFLSLSANKLNTSTKLTWVFPVLRATGGFITATLIQLLIQQRINTLADQYLVKRYHLSTPIVYSEAAVQVDSGDTKKHQIDVRTWLMLFLLLIGLVASVAGYVGCFSVVQIHRWFVEGIFEFKINGGVYLIPNLFKFSLTIAYLFLAFLIRGPNAAIEMIKGMTETMETIHGICNITPGAIATTAVLVSVFSIIYLRLFIIVGNLVSFRGWCPLTTRGDHRHDYMALYEDYLKLIMTRMYKNKPEFINIIQQ
jgi:hypothetical protein